MLRSTTALENNKTDGDTIVSATCRRATFQNPLRRYRQHSGQALVEFALCLPFLAVLLFGIIQYGFIFNAYMTLRHATHVAARTVSLPGNTNTAESVVSQAISPMLQPSNLGAVTTTPTSIGGVPAFTVGASYNLPLIIKFVVPGATGSSLTITAQATYRSG
jgi:Flp pilus assembly protein TadG